MPSPRSIVTANAVADRRAAWRPSSRRARTPVEHLPVIAMPDRCWCGEPTDPATNAHPWPGQEHGGPHPRPTPAEQEDPA